MIWIIIKKKTLSRRYTPLYKKKRKYNLPKLSKLYNTNNQEKMNSDEQLREKKELEEA